MAGGSAARRGSGMEKKKNNVNMDGNGRGRRGFDKNRLWNGKKTMIIQMEMDVAGGGAGRTGSGTKKRQ